MLIANRINFFIKPTSYPWDYRVAYIEKASGSNSTGGFFSTRFKIFPRHDDVWSATYSIKNNVGNDHRCIGDNTHTPYVGAYTSKYRFGFTTWKEPTGISTAADKVVTWRKVDQSTGYMQLFVNKDPTQQVTCNEDLYYDSCASDRNRDPSSQSAYTLLFAAGCSFTYGQNDIGGHGNPYAYLGTRIYDYLYIMNHPEYEQYGIRSQHLIPCIYQGEPTFYDEFNKVFLEKFSTGTFTAGPQVKDDGSDIVYD